jgi:hypothetical protein
MAGTAQSLRNPLIIAPRPFRLTPDNGFEFVGKEFIAVSVKDEIENRRTTAFSPWENGKVVRWWPTDERARVAANSVIDIVTEYNAFWADAALGFLIDPQVDTTRAQAWNNWERWTGQADAGDIYS